MDKSKQKDVDLIFRKMRSSDLPYKELIYGNRQHIRKYRSFIEGLVSADVFEFESEKMK